MKEFGEKKIHLLDYWRVLVKRRWVVFTCLSVVVSTVFLGTILATVFTLAPQVEMQAQIFNDKWEKQYLPGKNVGRVN